MSTPNKVYVIHHGDRRFVVQANDRDIYVNGKPVMDYPHAFRDMIERRINPQPKP